jgi:hypothetical protein
MAVHAQINWDVEYLFLDKELQQVVRDAELGRRLVDKLVRSSAAIPEKTFWNWRIFWIG